MMARFTDKVAIVTGGAGGIGLATGLQLGREGARVAIVERERASADKACAHLKAAGAPDALPLACDVARPDDVAAAVAATMTTFGCVDVIVNNAGRMSFAPIEELTTDDWMAILSVDLLGAFYFIQQAFRVMRPGGAIVNVASIHAVETTPGVAPYAAAKAGLVSLTRSAALEGKPRGIRVNAILPGAVDTPMLWANPNVRAGLENIERTDVGQPEDIAAAICFLASGDAAFVQGAALRVDGGRLSRL